MKMKTAITDYYTRVLLHNTYPYLIFNSLDLRRNRKFDSSGPKPLVENGFVSQLIWIIDDSTVVSDRA